MIRSLAKKRREVAELEETTKQLRHQVKAKKQNIATLEDLIKESQRVRNAELLSLRLNKGKSRGDPPPQAAAGDGSRMADNISFFVCGPEGLCVEFTEKADFSVRRLLTEAARTFRPLRRSARGDVKARPSSSSGEEEEEDDDGDRWESLQLVLRGKVLLPEATLGEADVRPGDTLLLLSPHRAKRKQRPRAAVPAPAPVSAPAIVAAPQPEREKEDPKVVSEMLQFLAQQQQHMKDFAHDMK